MSRPWPVFRRAIARIGDALAANGVIGTATDVHFLHRDEVREALSGRGISLDRVAAERRATWTLQRRVAAPLVLGRPPRMLAALLEAADKAMRDPEASSSQAVRGTPASAGRATGRARVIRSAEEFDLVEPGDVLVCPVTTPAWTPLFARIAAVVTDVGSVASHASIIAREYGIPAVVATGDGTTRIDSGSRVTVDGGAGLVLAAD